jgi:hypothetical protein
MLKDQGRGLLHCCISDIFVKSVPMLTAFRMFKSRRDDPKHEGHVSCIHVVVFNVTPQVSLEKIHDENHLELLPTKRIHPRILKLNVQEDVSMEAKKKNYIWRVIPATSFLCACKRFIPKRCASLAGYACFSRQKGRCAAM